MAMKKFAATAACVRAKINILFYMSYIYIHTELSGLISHMLASRSCRNGLKHPRSIPRPHNLGKITNELSGSVLRSVSAPVAKPVLHGLFAGDRG